MRVYVVMDIDGTPVTASFTQPEGVESLTYESKGLTLHVHVDAAEMAKALMPEMVKQIKSATGLRS